MIARTIRDHRRRLMPFVLATRLISLTSSTSMALAVHVTGVHAAEAAAPVQYVSVEQKFAPSVFLDATNAARVEAGVEPLRLNDELSRAALAKALDMKQEGYWAHYRPEDNKAPWEFIKEAGYDYTIAGENLARGFSTVRGITNAWMNSPAHRANLLSSKYEEVGFADVETIDENGDTVLLTVQMFGSR